MIADNLSFPAARYTDALAEFLSLLSAFTGIRQEQLQQTINDHSVSYLFEFTDALPFSASEKNQLVKVQRLHQVIQKLTVSEKKPMLSGPERVAYYFAPELQYAKREHLILALLNTKNEVCHISKLFSGGLDFVLPDIRLIFSEALKYHATGIIVIHNHPSGNPTPGENDRQITKRLEQAGELLQIPLLDHIIIGMQSYHSMMSEQTLPLPTIDFLLSKLYASENKRKSAKKRASKSPER